MTKRLFYFLLFAGTGLTIARSALAATLNFIPAAPGPNVTVAQFLQWLFNASLGLGYGLVILGLTLSGLFFIFSALGMPGMRERARDWLSGSVSGFLIFTLLYLILTTINPALAFFKFGNVITIPGVQTDTSSTSPGVYLFTKANCKGTSILVNSSTAQFSNPQQFASFKVVSDNNNQYGGIIYASQGYVGQCQLQLSNGCQTINLGTLQSVIVYKKSSPEGSATFYRNPGFTTDGGYLQINQAGAFQLNSLTFTGTKTGKDCNVPKPQQDCSGWNQNGTCAKFTCPTLLNDVASIQTAGNFLVVLEYNLPNNSQPTFCQTYPRPADINNIGQKQTSWDIINHSIPAFADTAQVIPIQQ